MLILVESKDVATYWQEALVHLKKAFAKSPLPVDVNALYLSLMTSDMKLCLLLEDGEMKGAGLVIIEIHDGVKVLNVYMVSWLMSYKSALRDFIELERVAVEKGCKYMIGYAEAGFIPTLKKFGMKPVKVMVSKKIGETHGV